MATVETKPITAEDFQEWAVRPENQDKLFELDRGEIVEMPSPSEFHSVICSLIAHRLWNYVFQRGQGYVCGNDSGLLVAREPDTVRGPDVMLFDEIRSLDAMSRRFTERVPKLVVEVLSPSDQPTKVNRRISQYQKRGIRLIWLVDPEVRSVTVYRSGEDVVVLDETDELTGYEVLPELRYRVSEFFVVPGPST